MLGFDLQKYLSNKFTPLRNNLRLGMILSGSLSYGELNGLIRVSKWLGIVTTEKCTPHTQAQIQ